MRLSCSILQKYPVFISSYGTSIRCCTSKFTYDVQRRLYQLHLYDALGFVEAKFCSKLTLSEHFYENKNKNLVIF